LARSFGQPFYEAQDADHGMETEDDPVNSAQVLQHVTIAMDAFVKALSSAPTDLPATDR
jgi:hypothetical protein